ncbi:methyl-accepting chemotaxis protein [Desulfobacterales bacterium HSG2]|nr:methyl-accepting chemotaxis protein [Desulfobacterales bacterium HSG2]
MKFQSLQTKLMVLFGVCLLTIIGVIVIYGIFSGKRTYGFMSDSMTDSAVAAAEKQLLANAHAAGFEIKAELEAALDSARTLADVFSGVRDKDIKLRIDRDRINGILRGVLTKNEKFVGIGNAWETDALDELDDIYAGTEGHDHTGRFIPYWSRGEDGKMRLEPLVDYESTETFDNGVRKGEYYLLPRESKRECAIDPYPYPVQGRTVWMTTMAAPILSGNTFYGIISIDLRLDFIQTLVEDMNKKLYSGLGRTGVVSHNGILVSASDNPGLVGKHSKHWMPGCWQECMEQLHEGKADVSEGDDEMEAFVPLFIGRTGNPWGIVIEVPKNAVLAQARELARKMKKNGSHHLMLQAGVGLGVSFFSLGLIWLVSKSITGPLTKGVDFAVAVARGDLTADMEVREKDEIGKLANSFNQMAAGLRDVMRNLSVTTDSLSDSSDELSSVSAQLASSAVKVNDRAETVAAASEQITASVAAVASATEQSSSSVSNIAAMTEEMSATFDNVSDLANRTAENVRRMAGSSAETSCEITGIATSVEEMISLLNEVVRNSEQANHISQNAVRRARDIHKKIDALISASKQIGKIVGVIRDIADQTNMLALNAAIEAAGAGEAGRGFAVVASEIKELAKQSAEATDEITGQIELMQTSTDEAVEATREISSIISDIAGFNDTTASSVEKQAVAANKISKSVVSSAMTVKQVADDAAESAVLAEDIARATDEISKTASDVARNVDELAKGVEDVARSSGEAAKGVQDVSRNIQDISAASKETAADASRIGRSSKRLSQIAVVLSEIVKRFKIDA